MQRKRFSYSCAVLVFCLVHVTARQAEAQQVWPGMVIDEVQLNVPFHAQDTLVWCWVASAKMVAEAMGRQTPTQCKMLESEYGAPCCRYPHLCNRAGHISEIQNLIGRFGLSLTQLAVYGTGYDLLSILRHSNAPVVAWVDRSHFVVISGMRVVATNYGPWGIVRINDPIRGVHEQPWAVFSTRLGAILYVQR